MGKSRRKLSKNYLTFFTLPSVYRSWIQTLSTVLWNIHAICWVFFSRFLSFFLIFLIFFPFVNFFLPYFYERFPWRIPGCYEFLWAHISFLGFCQISISQPLSLHKCERNFNVKEGSVEICSSLFLVFYLTCFFYERFHTQLVWVFFSYNKLMRISLDFRKFHLSVLQLWSQISPWCYNFVSFL